MGIQRETSRGDNCSFRHDMNKRGKITQPNPSLKFFMQQDEKKSVENPKSQKKKSPSGRMSRWPCKDYLKGTCTNSFCEKWHLAECLFYKTKSGCRFGEKCAFAHRQVDEQPTNQDLRNRNFWARNGNFEKNAVVKNQGTKQRVQRILGDCWQWETNGQCVKGDNCSFRHDMNKRGKSSPSNPSPNSFMRQSERKPSRTRSPRGKSPSGRMSRWPCKDYLRGICSNSFCEKWHPPECLFYKTKSGCRFGEKSFCTPPK